MADGKQTVKGFEGSEPVDEQPSSLKHEDQVSDSTTGSPDEAGVRTSRPDVAIIGSLATGAGQHVPTAFLSEDHDTVSGRFIPREAKADAKK